MVELTPELITAILGAGGTAAILPKILDGLRAVRTGRAAREKVQNRTLVDRLTTSEARAEYEADFRREWEEYAGALRVRLVDLGVPVADLPERPNRKH